MNKYLIFVTIFAAACGVDQLAEVEATIGQTRQPIIGGKVSFTDPEVFMLRMHTAKGDGACTSTLIAPHTLLTAAHCIAFEGAEVTISATNNTNAFATHGAAWLPTEGAFGNPDYDAKVFTDDTAIIQLVDEPFAPVKPFNREPIDSYLAAPLRITGYGITVQAGDDYGTKRTTSSKLIGIEAKKFQLGIGTHGICQGDSGGPTMMTFPDGVERQVGIASTTSEVCGHGDTDIRVDRYTAFIDPLLEQIEGSCGADGRCRPGCAVADPDCACFDDGVCDSRCQNPAQDPDCASSCAKDGVCSKTACSTPDPDCADFGAACGRDAQCAGRRCITSEQHSVPYCSAACDDQHACPSGFECASGACRFPLKPAAALGENCELGAWCGFEGAICAVFGDQPQPRCTRRCFDSKDCVGYETCTVLHGDEKEGVCVSPPAMTQTPEPVVEPAKPMKTGCQSTRSEPWLLAAMLVLLRRRVRS